MREDADNLPKEENPCETKRAILEAARSRFLHYGYKKTTIDEIAADDPMRQQFDTLHEYSVWVLLTAIIASVVAFFLISYRKFEGPAENKSDIYDFSKEFKA